MQQSPKIVVVIKSKDMLTFFCMSHSTQKFGGKLFRDQQIQGQVSSYLTSSSKSSSTMIIFSQITFEIQYDKRLTCVVSYLRGWSAFSEICHAFLALHNVRFHPFFQFQACMYFNELTLFNNFICFQLHPLQQTVGVVDLYLLQMNSCINLMMPILVLHHIMFQAHQDGVSAMSGDSWMLQMRVI